MTLSVALRQPLDGFDLDVAFEAPPGVTVLFGRSGAGKTTIVNAVAGLIRPQAGRIAVDGAVLFDAETRVFVPPHRRRVGYVFQEGRLFPHLSVRQNLAFGRWFAPRDAAPAREADVVEMLGMGPLLDRRPGALSGGEKQRVAIGRALLAAPRLILADEPLASLDEARKAEILPYFERLRDEAALPILYVSHATSEVARLATTVVVIARGRVLRQGPAVEVLGDPGVTPLGAREAGAILETRVVAHHADGLSELDANGGAAAGAAAGGAGRGARPGARRGARRDAGAGPAGADLGAERAAGRRARDPARAAGRARWCRWTRARGGCWRGSRGARSTRWGCGPASPATRC